MAKIPKTMPEVNTDILRIGGSMYAVKKIQAKDININAELREFYRKRHEEHIAHLNDGVAETVIKDWDTQINHIRTYDGKNSKNIPSRLYERPVMVRGTVLLELRVITYAPNEVMGTLASGMFNAILPKLEGYEPLETLVVAIRPPFSFPLWVGYDQKTNALWTPMAKTFHTFSDGKVCTGDHTAKDFWRLSDANLEREMNRVNTFSPARREIVLNSVVWDIKNLCTMDNVVSSRKRGDELWNVSRS